MSFKDLPLISICIPVLNEGENIFPLYSRIHSVTQGLVNEFSFEFIFSDNQSTDDTWEKITSISSKDHRIKAIKFTTNVGFQESILANFAHASGLAMIQIDADLQDPPELIHDFINNWRKGYKVVYGIRTSRRENPIFHLIRKLGYQIISKLSDHPIPKDAGDFRLIDREVRDKLLQSKTPRPYLRGMIASLGFPEKGIEYSRAERKANTSKFPLRRVFKLGFDGLVNHSSWPLRFSTFSGIAILIGSLLLSCYYFVLKLFNRDLPQGLASIHILVLFGIGMNALFLGIIGDYLNRIYLIVRNEPRYSIQETINILEIK